MEEKTVFCWIIRKKQVPFVEYRLHKDLFPFKKEKNTRWSLCSLTNLLLMCSLNHLIGNGPLISNSSTQIRKQPKNF